MVKFVVDDVTGCRIVVVGYVELRSRICMTSFHSLRGRHRANFQGYVPFHTVECIATAFFDSVGCVIGASSNMLNNSIHI